MGIDYRKGEWVQEEGAVFDGDPYRHMIFSPTCTGCVHLRGYDGFAPVCDAYPQGIPPALWTGESGHDAPYPDSHGIRFAGEGL